jgi:hypothetical protein
MTTTLGEQLKTFVAMRDRIERAPAVTWKTAKDAAIEHALTEITRPAIYMGDFTLGAAFTLRAADGTDLGTLAAPNVAAMRARATQAPFGRGAERVVDTAVRDALEIAADDLTVTFQSPTWFHKQETTLENELLESRAFRPLNARRLVLYKLHLYGPGGHFDEHKDTPHGPGHIMSGILILGSPYDGGALEFAGGGEVRVTRPDPDEKSLRLAAWYTDVPHAVRPVTSGTRVVLQFDLFSTPASDDSDDADASSSSDGESSFDKLTENICKKPFSDLLPPNTTLRPALDAWWQDHDNEPVAFLLRHQYLTRGLWWDTLKGADRALYTALGTAPGITLMLEHMVATRRTPGGDWSPPDRKYAAEWGPMRTGPEYNALNVRLFIGPYVLHERATELAMERSAEHMGNEPMDGKETYLFAALVACKTTKRAADDAADLNPGPAKRARDE